jgi:ribosomal protein L11 methyltransferase
MKRFLKRRMAVTRVDILADKGAEEVLDVGFYALCGGVWIEDDPSGVRITCYPTDPGRFLTYVRGSALPIRGLTTMEEEEKDYVAIVRKHFTPVTIGDLTILPPWRKRRRRGRTIFIEPGMAFGTGRHESTKLMVKMMNRVPIQGKKVLDIGSGSGILAVNASFLGASLVAAVDHDPLAASAVTKACELNDSRNILAVCADIDAVKGSFDVVLANLDFATFAARAVDVTRRVAHGGYLIVSGIEEQYEDGVVPLFESLALLAHRRMKDWRGFVFQKVSTEG